MSNIEKLRQKIENSIKAFEFNGGIYDSYEAGELSAYQEILNIIDSLPEEKPSEDLEEAANKYAILDEEGKWKDGGKYKGFIAGAEWQKQRDAELIEIAYNDGITIGKTKQKEQLMKDAVEGEAEELYNDGESQCTVSVGTYFKPGDEVYVIKKED